MFSVGDFAIPNYGRNLAQIKSMDDAQVVLMFLGSIDGMKVDRKIFDAEYREPAVGELDTELGRIARWNSEFRRIKTQIIKYKRRKGLP